MNKVTAGTLINESRYVCVALFGSTGFRKTFGANRAPETRHLSVYTGGLSWPNHLISYRSEWIEGLNFLDDLSGN